MDSFLGCHVPADLVLVRDTRDRQGPVLAFGRQAWQAFAAKLKEDIDRRG